MTRDEVKKLLAIIAEVYPSWRPPNMKNTIDLWWGFMKDDDPKLIFEGLKNFINTDTKGFAPSIGQVRQASMIMHKDNGYDDTEEMIALVRRAVKNGNYGWKEEYATLPGRLRRAVGSAENIRAWASMDVDEFESVALSQVRRAYRATKARTEEIRSIMPLQYDDGPVLIQDKEGYEYISPDRLIGE